MIWLVLSVLLLGSLGTALALLRLNRHPEPPKPQLQPSFESRVSVGIKQIVQLHREIGIDPIFDPAPVRQLPPPGAYMCVQCGYLFSDKEPGHWEAFNTHLREAHGLGPVEVVA